MAEHVGLTEWAKILKCNASDLVKDGRKLLFESAELETPLPGSSKKRHQVQVLVCNDVVVLSQMKKKSTFSRKKNELSWFPVDVIGIETNNPTYMVTLYTDRRKRSDPQVLYCNNQGTYDALVESLKRCVEPQTSNGNGGPAIRSESDSPHSASSQCEEKAPSNRAASISQETLIPSGGSNSGTPGGNSTLNGNGVVETEEDSTLTDGVKIAAVFERMMMWVSAAGTGTTTAKEINKAEFQCIKVFQEMVETERTYVLDLRKLVSEYIQPLQEAAAKDDRIITMEDIAQIFSNVESILKVNSELLQSLQLGILRISRNGEIPSLCEVAGVFAKEFVQVVPFFKMYSLYCHHYSAALEKVTSLRETNKELGSLIQRREARKKNQQASLQSLLIKPVQRICKYPLLFRELLNNMNKIAAERQDDADLLQHLNELCNAEKEVQSIANTINSKVSDAENQDQVLRAFLELGGEAGCPGLVTPSRRFVRTEDVLMREAPFSETRRFRFRLYIFNDLVIFAKIQNGTLGKVGGTLGRSLTSKTKLKVSHRFDLDQCKGIKKTSSVDEEGRHAFEILRVFRAERTPKSSGLLGTSVGGSASPSGMAQAGAGAARSATQIQKFEVWGETKTITENLITDFEKAIKALEANVETREGATVGAQNKGRARGWAARSRPRQWRTSYSGRGELEGDDGDDASQVDTQDESQGSNIVSGSFSGAPNLGSGPVDANASFSSVVSVSPVSTAAGSTNELPSPPPASPVSPPPTPLTRTRSFERPSSQQRSLDDIKTRYMPAPLIKPDPKNGGTLRIDIEFPQGPLGLSLENSKSPRGVLVACVAALSVAERGGLALGDRVVAVGGNTVSEDATWDQVVDIIKSLPRPLTITFERTSETLAAGLAKTSQQRGKRNKRSSLSSLPSGASSVSSTPCVSPNSARSVESSATAGTTSKSGQRQWAAKMDRRKASLGTSRLLSLTELESYYSASAAAVSSVTDQAESILSKLDVVAKSQVPSMTDAQKKATATLSSLLGEILSTEKTYVCDLRKIVGEYMLPLRQVRTASNQLVLDPDDEQAIFLNVEGILKVNAELLNGLSKGLCAIESHLSMDDVIRVFCKEFQQIVPFFKVYSTFCHRYSTALATLVNCRKTNQQLDQFMAQREGRAENKHSLQNLLIKPVQRICKYPLFFHSLKDSASKLVLHADTETDILQAVSAVERIAAEVNQKVSEAENVEMVMKIYNMFGGESGCPGLFEPHRRFVAQFEVTSIKAPFYDGKPMPRTMFVFNDLILFGECKKRNSGTFQAIGVGGGGPSVTSYKLTDQVDLRKCDVKSLSSPSSSSKGTSVTSSPPGENKVDSSFQITQVSRVVVKNAANGGGNGSNLSPVASQGPNLNSTSNRVTTSIDKFRISCSSKEECQKIVDIISKEIENLVELDTSKSAMSGSTHSSGSLGPNFKQRESFTRRTAASGTSSSGPNSASAGGGRAWNKRNVSNSLEDLESKYNPK